MNSLKLIPLLLLFPALCYGSIIEVPTNYPTIQQAIHAALPQDLIMVCPGTYVENIDFQGKEIMVRGLHGPEVTVIDGNQAGCVVIFKNGETQSTVLEGFTITNGRYYPYPDQAGGGITCLNGSSPLIRNNIIKANSSSSRGGGISCDGSSPLISGNRIQSNETSSGGGILCINGSCPIIEYNRISGNEAHRGGGIACFSDSSAIIHDNIIHSNITEGMLSNGGGIFCFNSSPVITNNTIYGNDAGTGEGGGLYCFGYFDIDISNTIFWNNTANLGPEIFLDDTNVGPLLTVSIDYSTVESGLSSICVGFNCTFNWGPNMTTAAPDFIEVLEGDFHLKYTSPLRNQGDNGAVIGSSDFDGNPRISDGNADMGADEFHMHFYYTGDSSPGGTVNFKCIGDAGASPVWIWVSLDRYKTPIPTYYGFWHLSLPVHGFPLGTIPIDGMSKLSGLIPASTPVLSYFYLQALIGDQLSDLMIFQVN